MNNNHLSNAIIEAKSAFDQISQKLTKQLAEDRDYQESPTDVIAAQALTSEAFKSVAEV